MAKIPVKTVKDKEKAIETLNNEQDVEHEENSAEEHSPLDGQQGVNDAEVPSEESESPEVVTVEIGEIETADEMAAEETQKPDDEEKEVTEEDNVARILEDLQAKEQEAREHYDARLRLQAEFNNFKKRRDKEMVDFRKYANESLLQEILTIVDDFERAIAAAEQTHKLEDFLKGVELIFSKFLVALQKKGVKEIEAAEGQQFNPEIHEAVTQIETDEIEEGMIAQVFQKGYYLHDRVLRPPKVGVAKAKEG